MNNLVSIIMPAYNCENYIEETINSVIMQTYKNWELIIVDDCSTDHTRSVLKDKIEPLVSRIIYQEENGGKGAALRTGFQAATGDVVIIQDADLEYDPMEYAQVVNPIFEGRARVVYGSRFLNQKRKGYLANRLANRVLTIFSNFFTCKSILLFSIILQSNHSKLLL